MFKNRLLVCIFIKSFLLENMFLLDMDDLFEDLDFDFSGIDLNLKILVLFNYEYNLEKIVRELIFVFD